MWTSLDSGLRPTEVARAKTSWIDVDNAVLRIPKEDSAKNVGNWNVSIRDETANALDEWVHSELHTHTLREDLVEIIGGMLNLNDLQLEEAKARADER